MIVVNQLTVMSGLPKKQDWEVERPLVWCLSYLVKTCNKPQENCITTISTLKGHELFKIQKHHPDLKFKD